MKHLQTFEQKFNEAKKDWLIAAALAVSPFTSQSQDWVQRAANANLHFWEKCRLAVKPDRPGYISSGGREKSYKNEWDRISDLKDLDRDEKKQLKETCPEGVDLRDWAALTHESRRVSAVFGQEDYDKFVDDKGLLIDPSSIKDEEVRQSMEYGIKYMEPWFVYYRPIFPKARKITTKQLLDWWQSQPGGLATFREMLNSGYRGKEAE